jgi:hypothetical protein
MCHLKVLLVFILLLRNNLFVCLSVQAKCDAPQKMVQRNVQNSIERFTSNSQNRGGWFE